MRTVNTKNSIAETPQELIEMLQTSFEQGAPNYHPFYLYYTSISALYYMLGNGLLRLTNIRSPRLNDFREPREFGSIERWKRICIACFSVDKMENNAMWSAYGRPEKEAILIRIPSGVMKEMCTARVFVDCRVRKKSQYSLDGEEVSETDLTPITQSFKRCHHSVAYFPNIQCANDDDEVHREAVLKLYRDYEECANINVRLRVANPRTLDPLVGYVKRCQWMYECESRLRMELPSRYAERTAYLKLPDDFFSKISIILGPAFDVKAPVARETLRKFLDARGKTDDKPAPLIESAYNNVLNYDRRIVEKGLPTLPLIYKGKVVNRPSPQAEWLCERYQRIAIGVYG